MSILSKLRKPNNTHERIDGMTRGVFEAQLFRAGCDAKTILDCLEEPHEKWESLLEYFRNKND